MALEARHITLIESQDSILDLSDDEAAALQAVGKDLAGKREWWGSADDTAREASVVICTPFNNGRWRVRVSDAVGIIGFSTLQLTIEPKIPTAHLLFLLQASGEFPRLAPQRAVAMGDRFLWELILQWYVTELETVLRRGLLRDYEESHDLLPVVRGSVDPVETGRVYYRGQLAFDCVFDEFDFDSPPNRLLATAARAVVGFPTHNVLLRRRAKRAFSRFEDVSELRTSDLRWQTERRAGYYATATILARHIIKSVGRTILQGREPVTTFLIRTPEMVEAGLRTLLQKALPETGIEKRGLQLKPSTMTLNPDLVFNSGESVGDVKYKVLGTEWQRPDLYQLVAFATGFRANMGVLVHFARERGEQLPSVKVGHVQLHAASWFAQDDLDPTVALGDLADRLRSILV